MNLHPELGIQPRGNEIKDNCSLWDFYGHNHDGLTHDLSLFDHIHLDNFYNETYSAFLMISCKYKKDDCTKWWKVRVSNSEYQLFVFKLYTYSSLILRID